MNDEERKLCEKKGCNNTVLKGKYCEHCTQIKKERRSTALKIAGSVAATVGSFILAVILKNNNKHT